MPKPKIDLYINHALFHHNDGTWTVRPAVMGNDRIALIPAWDFNTGQHRTAQAAINAHSKQLRKLFPGWFKP